MRLNWQSIKRLFIQEIPDENPGEKLSSTIKNPPKGSFRWRIKKHYVYRVELEMKNWRSAVMLAEDPLRPRRESLYALYKSAMEDGELQTQLRTARNTVCMGDFHISKNGKEDKALRELFERPWFHDFLEHEVDTELWGHTLIEFDPIKSGKEFENIALIPRDHVRPEWGEVIIYTSDERGLPYDKPPLDRHLLEIGKRDNLGLLKYISKLIIRKEYALTDWSRRNERYGMPTIVIKTATRDVKELDAKEQMAKNMGSNGYIILDDQDEYQLSESNQAFAYQTYKDNAKLYDEYIAKIVNGQTGTTNEKAHVGAAEVHERILNDYTLARLRRIQNHLNFRLFPFLIKHGYPLQGAKFQFVDLLRQDNSKEKDTSQESPADQKKKPGPAGSSR